MKPFLLTCLALAAFTVFAVKLIVWIDKPAEPEILIHAALPRPPSPLPPISTELCPPIALDPERISHT